MGAAIRGCTHPAAALQVEAPSRPCAGAHRPRPHRRRAADLDGEASATAGRPSPANGELRLPRARFLTP